MTKKPTPGNLPANTDNTDTGDKENGEFVGAMPPSQKPATVNISTENVLIQPNVLAELSAMADRHPELAKSLVDNENAKNIRENKSFIVGMLVSAAVFIFGIGAAAWALVNLGWWQALMFVAAALALSHVIRTILTGEWSDTSWFARMLGVKPPKDP